jgi:hypothetical protein
VTARIYLFRRKDGMVFKDAVATLTSMGYKLEALADGRLEAKPGTDWVTCPSCTGLGSVSEFGGGWIKCTDCLGLGVY